MGVVRRGSCEFGKASVGYMVEDMAMQNFQNVKCVMEVVAAMQISPSSNSGLIWKSTIGWICLNLAAPYVHHAADTESSVLCHATGKYVQLKSL